MSKVLTAEYDAEHNVLRLAEPLDGVRNHEKVQVIVEQTAASAERPWLALSGSLSKEAGESLSRAIDELFPPWK